MNKENTLTLDIEVLFDKQTVEMVLVIITFARLFEPAIYQPASKLDGRY